MRPLLSGSGSVTPWLRTHWENLSACALICCTSAWFGPLPPFGSRCWQALWADWSWELLTPSCCEGSLGVAPLLSGSGKFGTPLERMQWEKAICREFVDPPAFDEPPGLPLHAAASSARPTMAIMAAAVRAVGGHDRRGRRMTQMLLFIMPSSGLDDRAGRRHRRSA